MSGQTPGTFQSFVNVRGTDLLMDDSRDRYRQKLARITLDSISQPAWGMGKEADVYFEESPVFNISPSATANGSIHPIAWFASDKTMRSGWAWGQAYLRDGVAAFVAQVGQGKLYAFGPEITFRAQTHGTFKLLFNQLYVAQ